MKSLLLSLLIILFVALSCINKSDKLNVQLPEEVSKGLNKAIKGSVYFEGRFERIEKINDREYNLVLMDEKDSLHSFQTLMPMDRNEIKLLKKEGNNIKVYYDTIYNAARNRNEKIIRYMEPIYKLK